MTETRDWITARTASSPKYLGLSMRQVQKMCLENVFPSAHKPGKGRKAHWRILRSEVLSHKFNNHKRDI